MKALLVGLVALAASAVVGGCVIFTGGGDDAYALPSLDGGVLDPALVGGGDGAALPRDGAVPVVADGAAGPDAGTVSPDATDGATAGGG